MKLKRSGGLPLWEWGCNDCNSLKVKDGGEARMVVAAARRHSRETHHSTWLHNILMWTIEATQEALPTATSRPSRRSR
ncbi:hypothetical protein LCGC14_2552730 [marine sediment metagenome]|uniref:Uncharacterized protein n=1 Tax=marine sediment metagenome TaxID=412755 RepID=A0A0F9DFG5_9ZZZZ